MKSFFTRLFIGICIFGVPVVVSANVLISEIMYDLEGADTDREWIEIQNNGSSPVDVSGYRLREATTNHTLTIISGSATLPANGYAVIADNSSKFLSDHPSFSGTLFDSSFSLSNTGESLILKDSALLDIDSITYSLSMGASEDGNSLHRQGSTFVALAPTPGIGDTGGAPPTSNTATSTGNTSQSGGTEIATTTEVSPSTDIYTVSKPQQIFPDAGTDKIAIVGADTYFEGKALGINKKALQNAEYAWNFGDGEMKKGQTVFHTYRYPGEYVVILDVSSGEYSNADRLLVKAIPAEVSIVSAKAGEGGFVEIKNGSPYELDLSSWQIQTASGVFALPHGTFILPEHSIRFSESSMNLLVVDGSIKLLYPSGATANEFILVSTAPDSTPVSFVSEKIEKPVAVVERVLPVEIRSTEASSSAAVASSHFSGASPSIPVKWFALLSGLILVSSSALVVARRSRVKSEEFEIIE